MQPRHAHYCIRCGRPGSADMYICPNCGASQLVNATDRVRQLAVVLNELHAPAFEQNVEPPALERVEAHYADELRRLSQPALAPAMPARRAVAAPPRAPRPPRKPHDWSWLAEQQANLLLFAGAFLTVIAALIYVGYSEQAVSGGLKVFLFSAYTLAFIAGGFLCLRIPRVVVAGRVFLAIGAVLVPLNFVTAYNVLEDTRITAEGMWLAGSIVSCAFYFGIAWLGLGRGYAISSGAALLSAALASIFAFDIAYEWAPLAGIAAAIVLIAPLIAGDERLRERVGKMWQAHAHVAAILAAVAVILIAATDDGGGELDFTIATRWFLPATLAAFLAWASLPGGVTRRSEFGVEIVAGFTALFLSVLYVFDAPPEAYVIALAGLAPVLGLALITIERRKLTDKLPLDFAPMTYGTAIAATAAAGIAGYIIIGSAARDTDPYVLATRWFLVPAFALAATFYLLDAFVRQRRAGVAPAAVALFGIAPSVVFALDVSPEHYALAFAVPALALAAIVRAPLRHAVIDRLPGVWRIDTFWVCRAAALVAAAIAAGAAAASFDADSTYAPDYRAFLPLTLAAVAALFALDASRARAFETSLAFFAAAAATIVAIPYTYDADPAHYGAALAAAAVAIAAVPRLARDTRFDSNARDVVTVIALLLSMIPFEALYYDDAPRVGAAVHFIAALMFALAAVRESAAKAAIGSERRRFTLESLALAPSAGWMYAVGIAATAGYFFTLRSFPAADDAEAGSIAVPFMALAFAFATLGAVTRIVRPELRLPLYVVSLFVALISLSAAADAGALAALLTAYVVLYAAVAAYEDAPLLGAPAAAFGFLAVAAWREHLGAEPYLIPIIFSAGGVALYAAAVAARSHAAWSSALRATAALYAIVAPAAGFAILAAQTDNGAIDPETFERSALYQWTTIAVFIAGALALVEAALSRRHWIIVPGSAVLTVALLLQVGRFNPDNVQPYTLIAGAYLLLLGSVLLARFRLVRDLVPLAVAIEALGAATIMTPAFLQSLDGGWRYELLLFIEATFFVALGVAVRRQGILGAGLVFTVIVGGRALFDAINALPNWVVAMIAGAALLAAGMAILVGRDRWTRWQELLLSWWEDTGGHGPAPLAK